MRSQLSKLCKRSCKMSWAVWKPRFWQTSRPFCSLVAGSQTSTRDPYIQTNDGCHGDACNGICTFESPSGTVISEVGLSRLQNCREIIVVSKLIQLRRIQGAKRSASESTAKQLEMQLARESEKQRQDTANVNGWGGRWQTLGAW